MSEEFLYDDFLQWYICKWQHGPAPGLTYYSGTERVLAEDVQSAKHKARRRICQRGAFSPGCIDVYEVTRGGERS